MMEDYPRTLLELEKWFSSEEACREYLEALRWPRGFVAHDAKLVNIGWAAVVAKFVLAVGIKLPLRQERFLKGHECH